jgi:hypothetical protein
LPSLIENEKDLYCSYTLRFIGSDAFFRYWYFNYPSHGIEALTSYSSDFEIILEKAANSPLTSSTLPILSIVLLLFGLIVLGVHLRGKKMNNL